MATSTTPMEDAIRDKLTSALNPSTLIIANDSAAHAHHQAMRGSVSTETHFRLVVVSDEFKAKPQPARHRMVYKILADELAMEGGVHALQLQTRTAEEQGKVDRNMKPASEETAEAGKGE
ncbi:MAG: hypothetical protein Q9159_004379 [Coniocarpon cinnabarinum]